MLSPSPHPLSETLPIGGLLTFLGGFIDVYTYSTRGGVFAFGQTGNLIFLGIALTEGRFGQILFYLLPIVCFVLGVYFTEELRHRWGINPRIHWQQLILWAEALILGCASLIPQQYNFAVIMFFSFASAMQTESFRKIGGQAVATTMCTGNLRSATELFYLFKRHKNPQHRQQSLHLYAVVFIFAVGALVGQISINLLGDKASLLGAAGLLGLSFFFRRPKA